MLRIQRIYQADLIYAATTSPPLWSWTHWQHVVAALEPVLGEGDGLTVRCTQELATTGKPVKFGRLSWGTNSHLKWVHDPPSGGAERRNWDFLGLEIAMPSWPACQRAGEPPDFYMRIVNYADSRPNGDVGVGIVVARAADRAWSLDPLREVLGQSCQRRLHVCGLRPWSDDDLAMQDVIRNWPREIAPPAWTVRRLV